jgi:hypothetical protein
MEERLASVAASDLVADAWNLGARFEILSDTDPAFRAAQQQALRSNPLLRKTMKIVARGEQLKAAVQASKQQPRLVKRLGTVQVESAAEAAEADQAEEARRLESERRLEERLFEYADREDLTDADLDVIWNSNADHVALLIRKVIERDEQGRDVEITDRKDIQELLRSEQWVGSGMPFSGEPGPDGMTPGQPFGRALQQWILAEAARITRDNAATSRGALGNSVPSSAGASAAGGGCETTSAAS